MYYISGCHIYFVADCKYDVNRVTLDEMFFRVNFMKLNFQQPISFLSYSNIKFVFVHLDMKDKIILTWTKDHFHKCVFRVARNYDLFFRIYTYSFNLTKNSQFHKVDIPLATLWFLNFGFYNLFQSFEQIYNSHILATRQNLYGQKLISFDEYFYVLIVQFFWFIMHKFATDILFSFKWWLP